VRPPPFHWWRTVFVLIPAIAVYTIVLGTLSLASSLFDSRGYFAHRCARLWSWLILATTGVKVTPDGLDRLERGRTYIFVSNHQSIYDIPIVFATLPFQLRIIAKESLGRFPFLGWHLKHTGHMLVDRTNPDRHGIFRQWAGLVARGVSLIVFPEGTRSVDGRVARFKGGSFLMAIRAGLPVVPVSISGSRHVMLKGRLMVCPGRVRLTVHDPIPTDTSKPTVEAARRLAERVREAIRAAVDEGGPCDLRAARGRPGGRDRGARPHGVEGDRVHEGQGDSAPTRVVLLSTTGH
jgi:1-acyl-sn-glycerol-3-phosphate acyltransferase